MTASPPTMRFKKADGLWVDEAASSKAHWGSFLRETLSADSFLAGGGSVVTAVVEGGDVVE